MFTTRSTLLIAVLLGGGLPGVLGCEATSDSGESPAPNDFDKPFFLTPEVRQEESRRIFVEAHPGELQRALRGARPGDVIHLAPGTHEVGSGRLALSASGTPDRWIRVGGADGTRQD